MLQSRWHVRSKKGTSLADLSIAITIFRCLASWGAHGIELDTGVPWQQSCPTFWFFWRIPCLLKKKVFSEAVGSQREDLYLLISLQACLGFVTSVSQRSTLQMLQRSPIMQPSTQVLNGAGTTGYLLTFLYRFVPGCSAMPRLTTGVCPHHLD